MFKIDKDGVFWEKLSGVCFILFFIIFFKVILNGFCGVFGVFWSLVGRCF